MDPSPMRAITGRFGAPSWAPTAAGGPNPRPPPTADMWETDAPGRTNDVIGTSLEPASLTNKASAGAARPTAFQRSAGRMGAPARSGRGTSGRLGGAGRDDSEISPSTACIAARMSATYASPTGARAASSGSLVM